MAYGGEAFDIFIRCTEGGKTNFLGEFGEFRVGKEGYMSKQFMATVSEIRIEPVPGSLVELTVRECKVALMNVEYIVLSGIP